MKRRSPKMRVESARFEMVPGGGFIRLRIDGKEAILDAEQKLWPEFGLLYLGSEWEQLVPPITLPPRPENGRPDPWVLYGFTGNPRIVRIFEAGFAMETPGDIIT